jgi:subtilisin family serine protease
VPSKSIRPHLVVASSVMAMAVAGGVTAIVAHAEVPYDGPALAAAGPHVPGHVLVKFDSGVSATAQAAMAAANGAKDLSTIPALQTHVLSVPVGAEQHVIDALERSGKVQYAELDGIMSAATTPDDPQWSQQWGPAKVNLPTAWSTSTGSSGIVIAHLDSGVDFTHPDLQGRFMAGYDFINNDSDPTDDQGHGTSTAGILGAATNNGVGVAGACWKCTIMPVKVLDSSNRGTWAQISSGITYATDHGARIISMSIYGTTGSSTLQSAINYAESHGVLVVVAAGNDSTSTPSYPASYAGVLSVGGTDSSDKLYSWSDYGSWVQVAAPGCEQTTEKGGSYWNFCGTSTATPIVAGIAGVMLSADPSATAAQLMQALETTAVPVGANVHYGRVDAAAALSALLNGTVPAPSPSPTTSPSSSPSPSPTPTTSPSTSPTPTSTSSSPAHGHKK